MMIGYTSPAIYLSDIPTSVTVEPIANGFCVRLLDDHAGTVFRVHGTGDQIVELFSDALAALSQAEYPEPVDVPRCTCESSGSPFYTTYEDPDCLVCNPDDIERGHELDLIEYREWLREQLYTDADLSDIQGDVNDDQ